ncbi:MAG: hypothetical protein ABIK98_13220 [Pseudomonadota bacterium]|nr:hypothetical protein [Desulfobacterales bacterium]
MRLFGSAQLALKQAWTRRARIRYLRLACERLTYPPAQLQLFPECEKEKKTSANLIAALDTIRNRFGFDAVRVGRTLNPNLS